MAATGTWTLDKQHTDVSFSVKHMMVATVKGHFADVDAEIEIDEVQPEASRVRATIAAGSLSTRNAERDGHLKSPDFFDVERFPAITFVSTSVRRVSAEAFRVTGDLTIRDVTRTVTLNGEFTGPVASPWGDRRAGFTLEGEIDREEFGLTWNVALETGGVLVGRTVKLLVDAEVAQAAVAAA
ncbi:MAG: YceI family protein [Dehalococcoidia bacterium]